MPSSNQERQTRHRHVTCERCSVVARSLETHVCLAVSMTQNSLEAVFPLSDCHTMTHEVNEASYDWCCRLEYSNQELMLIRFKEIIHIFPPNVGQSIWLTARRTACIQHCIRMHGRADRTYTACTGAPRTRTLNIELQKLIILAEH